LELSQFGVELNNSVVEFGNSGVFVCSLLVQGVNDLGSQVGEGFGNVSNGSLVGEVLFGGQFDQSHDQRGEG
jgi:hypothetical protein